MNIENLTNEQLIQELIPLDDREKDFKTECLKELLAREYSNARDQGAFEQSFCSST